MTVEIWRENKPVLFNYASVQWHVFYEVVIDTYLPFLCSFVDIHEAILCAALMEGTWTLEHCIPGNVLEIQVDNPGNDNGKKN